MSGLAIQHFFQIERGMISRTDPVTAPKVFILTSLLIAPLFFMAAPSLAAEYSVVFEKLFHPGDSEVGRRAYSLTKTIDAGYVFTVENMPWQPYVIKVKGDGQKIWERLPQGAPLSLHRGFAVLSAGAGGVLLVGQTNSTDLVPAANPLEEGALTFPSMDVDMRRVLTSNTCYADFAFWLRRRMWLT